MSWDELTDSRELESVCSVDNINVCLQFEASASDVLVVLQHGVLESRLHLFRALLEYRTWNRKIYWLMRETAYCRKSARIGEEGGNWHITLSAQSASKSRTGRKKCHQKNGFAEPLTWGDFMRSLFLSESGSGVYKLRGMRFLSWDAFNVPSVACWKKLCTLPPLSHMYAALKCFCWCWVLLVL